MVRFYGRSPDTYKMPNKPIKQGYKIYALADAGYIWWFIWASRKQGLTDTVKYKHLSLTASMVLQTVKRLPSRHQYLYTIYMDNYFSSIPLFRLMRSSGYGACGITRPGRKEWLELLRKL